MSVSFKKKILYYVILYYSYHSLGWGEFKCLVEIPAEKSVCFGAFNGDPGNRECGWTGQTGTQHTQDIDHYWELRWSDMSGSVFKETWEPAEKMMWQELSVLSLPSVSAGCCSLWSRCWQERLGTSWTSPLAEQTSCLHRCCSGLEDRRGEREGDIQRFS